jgi:hypothetical protein
MNLHIPKSVKGRRYSGKFLKNNFTNLVRLENTCSKEAENIQTLYCQPETCLMKEDQFSGLPQSRSGFWAERRGRYKYMEIPSTKKRIKDNIFRGFKIAFLSYDSSMKTKAGSNNTIIM